MPKVRYDVDTKTKLIDIQNQWWGGLKTVDTDDALGATYLRDAQNVSISEYNFLEKRYGLLKKKETTIGNELQGYFEYVETNGDITVITMVGGRMYVNAIEKTPVKLFGDIFATTFVTPSYPYQDTRFVEGARINDKLYIYTGSYPVYYNGNGNIYLVAPHVVNYDELRDLSFNLIDDDFAETNFQYWKDGYVAHSYVAKLEDMFVNKAQHTPLIPSRELIGTNLVADNTTIINSLTKAQKAQIMFTYALRIPTEWFSIPGVTLGVAGAIVTGIEYKSTGALVSEYVALNTDDWDSNFLLIDDQLNDNILVEHLRAYLNNVPVGMYDFRVRIDAYMDDQSLEITEHKELSYEHIGITITAEPLEIPDNIPETIKTCNRVVEHFGKHIIYGDTSNPENLYISSFKDPTYFPAYHYMEFNNELQEGLTSVIPFMNILVVQTESKTYGVKGNTALEPLLFNINETTQFEKFNINLTVGAIAPRSVRPVRNRLYFLSRQGLISLKSLYAVDEQYNIENIDKNIANIVPKDVDAVAVQHDNQYWIDFPNHGFSLRYYIDKKAWVKDVYAIEDYQGVFKYIASNGGLRIITNRSLGKLYDILVDKSLPYDFETPPLTRIVPAYLDQGMPFHPKNYKELKMNLTLQNEYNLGKDALEIFDQEAIIATGYCTGSFYGLVGHTYRFTFPVGTFPEGESEPTKVFLTAYRGVGQNSPLPGYTEINSGDTFVDIYVGWSEEYLHIDYAMTNSNNPEHINTYLIESDLVIHDVTYDNQVDFDVWATTEKSVLATPESTTVEIINEETVEVYNKESNLKFDMGTNLGTWVFGISEFGDVLTAVKTLKLSGKGYNFRFKIEDQTASKWTLESIGITFKLKKARSR